MSRRYSTGERIGAGFAGVLLLGLGVTFEYGAITGSTEPPIVSDTPRTAESPVYIDPSDRTFSASPQTATAIERLGIGATGLVALGLGGAAITAVARGGRNNNRQTI